MNEPSTEMDRILLGNTRDLKEIRVSSFQTIIFNDNLNDLHELKLGNKIDNCIGQLGFN